MDVSNRSQFDDVEMMELDEEVVVDVLSKEMVREVVKVQDLVINAILELRKENQELKRKIALEKECKVCEQDLEKLDLDMEKGKELKAGSSFQNLLNNLDSLELDWDKSVKDLIGGIADFPVEKADQKKKVDFQEEKQYPDLVDFEEKIKEKLKFTAKKNKAKKSAEDVEVVKVTDSFDKIEEFTPKESKAEKSTSDVDVVKETDSFDKMLEKIRRNTKETIEDKETAVVKVETRLKDTFPGSNIRKKTMEAAEEKKAVVEKNEVSVTDTFSGSLEELDDVVKSMIAKDQDGTLSSCTVCEIKITRSVELRNHIEKNHFTSLAISCNLCSKMFRTRKILSVHVARSHGHEFETVETSKTEKRRETEIRKETENVPGVQKPVDESESYYDDFVNNENLVYFCDQCDHRTDCDESLNKHRSEEHSEKSKERETIQKPNPKGGKMAWNCKECVYKAAAKKNLKKHYRNVHYKIGDVTIEDFNEIFSKQF